MRPLFIVGVIASLATAACSESPAPTPRNSQAAEPKAPPQADRVYAANGSVTAIAGDQVTISHGPVEGLGWPAMTMTFRAEAAQMVEGIAAGDRVAFQFRESDGSYVLTSISKR